MPIKHISLIVSVDNHQAGIIECRLVLLLRVEGDGTVGGQSHWRFPLVDEYIIGHPEGD